MTSSNGNALLALCEGNSLLTGEFPSQRPVTRIFDVFFDLRLNTPLTKPSKLRWLGTPRANYGVSVIKKTKRCIPLQSIVYLEFPTLQIAFFANKPDIKMMAIYFDIQNTCKDNSVGGISGVS